MMKHLKLLAIVLLAVALLLPLCAEADDGLPYMEQIWPKDKNDRMLMTPESYPEVCLTLDYFPNCFINASSEPYLIHFPCPTNTFVEDFNAYASCSAMSKTGLHTILRARRITPLINS